MSYPYFDLPTLLSLADSGAYGGNRVLSANSAVLALCAGVWLSELENWQGAGYNLTDDEIDEIDEIVATCQYEVMTENGGSVGAYQLIDEQEYTSDETDLTFENFDASEFSMLKLLISGLHSDTTTARDDPLQIKLNSVGTAGPYNSVSSLVNASGLTVTEYTGSVIGIRPHGVCGGTLGGLRTIGFFELTIVNPRDTYWKQMNWSGGIPSQRVGEALVSHGVGYFERTQPITKIEVAPSVGTGFEVGGVSEPDALRCSLYGVN